MSRQPKTNSYDPVKFIKDHTQVILPERSVTKNIEFSGFSKKIFHSADRPGGKLTITYIKDSGKEKLQLYVKQHPDAIRVFNHMSYAYDQLNQYNLGIHMPKPFICDTDNNTNFMEFASGTTLTYKVLGEILLQRTGNLSNLFFRIGRWLKNYHQISRSNKTVAVNEVEKKIIAELKTSPFFKSAEKNRIEFILEKMEFNNDNMFLVKPHNDFGLRNIIFIKPDNFKVIDWDAIFHKKFAPESTIWNDITSLITHINSMLRFSPVITRKEINILTDSFLRGYFEEIKKPSLDKDIKNHLYLFTLCFYLGIIGDRALPVIYKGKLGLRYINVLHKSLLNGTI